MTEDKSKKPFKLKTLDQIQNDVTYEISIFPRKRDSTTVFGTPSSSVSRINEERKLSNNSQKQNNPDEQVSLSFFFNP